MEPYQARLTLGAFLALSAVIVFNALYLQADPGLAVRMPVRQATAGLMSTPRQSPRDNVLVAAVRRELDVRNYFTGEGGSAALVGAVMAFQYDHGLPVDGIASDNLLKSLLLGVEIDSEAGETVPAVEGALARQMLAEVQGTLSGQGYYNGEIDGFAGQATAAAIRRFETDRGLPVTGRVSGLLVQELERATGRSFAGKAE